MTSKFQHGDLARDVVTGFEGVVTGHADYITGCDQYLLSPRSKSADEKKDSFWLDENRLELVEPSVVNLAENSVVKGAGEQAPIK